MPQVTEGAASRVGRGSGDSRGGRGGATGDCQLARGYCLLPTVDGGQNQNADEQANEKVFSFIFLLSKGGGGGGNRREDAVCCTHKHMHTHMRKVCVLLVSQQQSQLQKATKN